MIKHTIVVSASVIGAVALYTAFARPPTIEIESVLETLDEKCLGCGYDAYAKTIIPHPMAFGLLASVGAKIHHERLMRTSADWLVMDGSLGKGKSGWGLGFSWDAFNDDSINPPETVYGITTAIAVAGLLDAYEVTRDPVYAGTAAAALDYYKSSFTLTEKGGYFWYSDQLSDNINVYNVSSMLMGQYARASRVLSRLDFAQLANQTFGQLMADVRFVGEAPYWSYSDRVERPNDAVHAAYTAQGLVEYARYSGNANLFGHEIYLASFLQDHRVREFSPLHDRSDKLAERPARVWGLGMLIYTLTQLGDTKGALQIGEALDAYRVNETDVLGNLPGARSGAEPRMVAHVALGLAELRLSKCRRC